MRHCWPPRRASADDGDDVIGNVVDIVIVDDAAAAQTDVTWHIQATQRRQRVRAWRKYAAAEMFLGWAEGEADFGMLLCPMPAAKVTGACLDRD